MAVSFVPTASEAETRPMMELNTTPLIDNMLVAADHVHRYRPAAE